MAVSRAAEEGRGTERCTHDVSRAEQGNNLLEVRAVCERFAREDEDCRRSWTGEEVEEGWESLETVEAVGDSNEAGRLVDS